MKITKLKLRQIIKEELEGVLQEARFLALSRKAAPVRRTGRFGSSGPEDPDSDADDAAELEAGLNLTGFELKKERGPGPPPSNLYFIVDKETGEKVLGPFAIKASAEERMNDPGLRGDYEAAKKILATRTGGYNYPEDTGQIREGGAFASDEEIQDIVDVASEVDPDIQEFSEFYEAARIAWNEGRLKSRYEPSKHELRQAWKKHPGNRFTHDVRGRY